MRFLSIQYNRLSCQTGSLVSRAVSSCRYCCNWVSNAVACVPPCRMSLQSPWWGRLCGLRWTCSLWGYPGTVAAGSHRIACLKICVVGRKAGCGIYCGAWYVRRGCVPSAYRIHMLGRWAGSCWGLSSCLSWKLAPRLLPSSPWECFLCRRTCNDPAGNAGKPVLWMVTQMLVWGQCVHRSWHAIQCVWNISELSPCVEVPTSDPGGSSVMPDE